MPNNVAKKSGAALLLLNCALGGAGGACGGAPIPALGGPGVGQAKTRSARARLGEVVSTHVREGDPGFGVSALVVTAGFATNASEAPYWLGRLAERRLRARGHDVTLAMFVGGYRVTAERANARDAAIFATDLAGVFSQPPTEPELAAVIDARGSQLLALTTPCGSETAAVAAHVAMDEVRSWASLAYSRARVRVGMVGPSEIDGAACEALLRALPRHAITPPITAPLLEDEFIARPSLRTPRVSFVLWDADAARASALADAWTSPRSTVGGVLRTRMDLQSVSVALGAVGACTVLEGNLAADDLAQNVADAMRSTLDANKGPLGAEAVASEITFALSAPTAAEAAERWVHAVGPAPATPAESAARVGYRVEAPAEWLDGLDNRVREARASLASPVQKALSAIDVRATVEKGQGELHLLFGAPCMASEETETDAGEAALWMRAASHVDPPPAIQINAWANGQDIGLHVHGPALAGETPNAHAERLARALARALLEAQITEAQAEVSRLLSSDEQGAFEALAIAAAPTAPGRISVYGTRRSVARMPSARTQFRRLGQGPLRLAVIAPSSLEQADRAARVLEEYVPRGIEPERAVNGNDGSTCSAVASGTPVRGRLLHVRVGAETEAYVAAVLPPSADARMISDYLAFALEREMRRDGGQDLGGDSDHVLALGGASSPVVAIHLRPTRSLNAQTFDERVAATEKRFGAFVSGTGTDAAALRRAYDVDRTRWAVTPAGRLVTMFRGAAQETPPADIHERAVRALSQGDSQGRIVIVSRPKSVR